MISGIFAIFLAAIIGGLVARRFNQPLIAGYLVSSVIFSAVFGQVLPPESAETIGQIGLTLLLFAIGLSFSFRRLARVKFVAIGGAILQVIVTTAIFAVIFVTGLKMPILPALIFAYSFSMASTAVVSKIIAEKGKADTLFGEIAVGWLMIQDLAVLPFLVVISQISGGGQTATLVWQSVLFGLVKSAILLYLVVILGKKLIPLVLEKIAKVNSQEIFALTVIFLILVSALVAGSLGFSLSIGAFIAGLIIAESAQNHTVFSEIRPLRDVFAVVFFVSIGLGTNLAYFANLNIFVNLLVITLVVFLVKSFVSCLICQRFKYHLKTATEVGFALSGIGEFALIMGAAALQGGLISAGDNAMLSGITILSLITSPFFIGLGLPFFEFGKKVTAKWSPRLFDLLFSEFDHYKKTREEITLADHVVICGHGRVGRQISRILALSDTPYLVIDFNHNVISQLQSSGVETILGDPADFDVLRFARIDRARAVVVAVPDIHSQELIISYVQTIKPGVPIVCRSHFDEDRLRLYALGANYVVQPEMEAGYTMSHKVLDVLGFEKVAINGFVRQARKEQER